MMTGFLSFYRKSSSVWKDSDTWLSRYPGAPSIVGLGKSLHNLDILFFWWSLTLGTLLILYGSLLFEYIQHNRRGRLPSGVNASDYRALSERSVKQPRCVAS